jgi:hypothetical protein
MLLCAIWLHRLTESFVTPFEVGLLYPYFEDEEMEALKIKQPKDWSS